ncbi:MAG: Lsm family RNA-binding protein [Candidatus Odinarchaeia archaeon]
MAESTASRRFFRELTAILESLVLVKMDNGSSYQGTLKGYDPNTLSVTLANAKSADGTSYHRIFLYGNKINEILKTEEPFDLAGLAEELKKLFPPGEVKYIEEARMINILNKIKVTEEGVEGVGPLAERVRKVYDAYFKEKQAK